ncbi:pilus assembly protein TadG-related protein [Thermoflexus sp.]|uniref:pilus assembly protein TadG-related protein n=1 Tax=Thermoflexus sp. TaxID=1969742 RepID=UPI0025FB88ED|nr:pilus assembly protein TadG-related protein [Thermoflexus sp.]MCS7351003.1 hypothetical protein [Thermoflexus sp.]MCX7691260.1 hypothetical protein [Thermoflexus sp.]MDW8180455.1 hypothetical protein [Anaerolineae bacterium]
MDALGTAVVRARRWAGEERGASALATILLGFLLLLGSAVLYNFALIGYARHRAVTAIDAGALAGAEEIARYLSTTWELCVPAGTPPSQVVALYDQNRGQTALWLQMGYAAAVQYARLNGSQLLSYRVYRGPEFWMVLGYPLRQILVDADGQRMFGLAGPIVGGQNQRVHAQATAEVYLRRWRYRSWDCSPNPETPMVYYWFQFEWGIRLIR